MDRTGIRELVIEEIQNLAYKNGVNQVILFGSRARGSYKRTSDIDLAVPGGNTARSASDVEEKTSTMLKYDVVDLGGSVQEKLWKAILREGKVIYEKI